MKNNHIQTINFNSGLKWINITKLNKPQISYLEKNFKFDKADLKDCLPPLQRPKLMEYNEYLFMILQFPVYNRNTGEIESSEVDFFIGKNYLITVHENKLEPIKEIFEKHFKTTLKEQGQNIFDNNPAGLLYDILNSLLHYCFPMLNHLNQDIDAIEARLFKIDKDNVAAIKEILRIKRNIVDFRKIMQAHKSIIQKLISCSKKLFITYKLEAYYNNLVNHTKDIWEFLENYKDTIDALHETYESLNADRLNQIIKTLTIFSVIVFPLTLLAAIFGMNTMNSMPFVSSPFDFWIIIGIMLLGVFGMILYFKTRRWI